MNSAKNVNSSLFDSLPFAEGIEILGAPILEMEIAVDRPLALLVARLCDVDASGASTRVTYGVLNLSHRHSDAEPEAPRAADPSSRKWKSVNGDHERSYAIASVSRGAVEACPSIGNTRLD